MFIVVNSRSGAQRKMKEPPANRFRSRVPAMKRSSTSSRQQESERVPLSDAVAIEDDTDKKKKKKKRKKLPRSVVETIALLSALPKVARDFPETVSYDHTVTPVWFLQYTFVMVMQLNRPLRSKRISSLRNHGMLSHNSGTGNKFISFDVPISHLGFRGFPWAVSRRRYRNCAKVVL